jgi:hypothetical protein
MSIVNFFEEFNGRKWEKFNSEKVCTITYARIQGKARPLSLSLSARDIYFVVFSFL